MHNVQAAGRADPVGRSRALLFAVAAAGLIADQVTKAVAVATLRPGHSVPFISGVWHWTIQRNPGAAFSIFTKAPVVFTVVAFIISIGIVIYANRVHGTLQAVAFGLVLGGALGNLSDRLVRSPGPFRGHVVDFIDWRVWPTFNVADVCVVSGAALLFIASMRSERAAKRSTPEPVEKEQPAERPDERMDDRG